MVTSRLVRVVVALVPVMAFLGLLMLLDSFKLVRLRAVAGSIAVGGVAALLAVFANGFLLDTLPVTLATYSRYLAPLVEEALKGIWVVYLVRQGRVGFLVDAAIHGFAVGAGFALVENVEYLRNLEGASLSLWFARGCGTAILHGATVASFAMLAKDRWDRTPGAFAFGPAFVVAVVVHSAFNHFVLPPIVSALVLLATLPFLLMFVFDRSERATRGWLAAEFDGDVEMLQQIVAGGVPQTRIGHYLESLKTRFPGEVVADMLCLLQVQLELSIRAKGILMAREAGLEVPIGPDVTANLKEFAYLRGQIGRTGLLAMQPILRGSSRDVWQIAMLQDAGTGGTGA
jgi:RsiW-degrading membrane proteinase PrsW (M82 family)